MHFEKQTFQKNENEETESLKNYCDLNEEDEDNDKEENEMVYEVFFEERFRDRWEEILYYESLRPLIKGYKTSCNAPFPINLPSLKSQKEKENDQKIVVKNEICYDVLTNIKLNWVTKPVVNKPSHEDGLRGIMSEQKPLEKGWFMVEKKNKLSFKKDNKTNDPETLKKTKLCISFLKRKGCLVEEKQGICNFAHTVKELKPLECKFGSKCELVLQSLVLSLYQNYDKKKCEFLHPTETIENYVLRMQNEKIKFEVKKDVIQKPKLKDDVPLKLNWLSNTFEYHQPTYKIITEENKISGDKNKVKNTQIENGWKKVEKNQRTSKIKPPEKKETLEGLNETRFYSKLCWSVIEKTSCPHRECKFAHSYDQLKIKVCDFDNSKLGKKCGYVFRVEIEGETHYSNIEGKKMCMYKHEYETNINFFKRTNKK